MKKRDWGPKGQDLRWHLVRDNLRPTGQTVPSISSSEPAPQFACFWVAQDEQQPALPLLLPLPATHISQRAQVNQARVGPNLDFAIVPAGSSCRFASTVRFSSSIWAGFKLALEAQLRLIESTSRSAKLPNEQSNFSSNAQLEPEANFPSLPLAGYLCNILSRSLLRPFSLRLLLWDLLQRRLMNPTGQQQQQHFELWLELVERNISQRAARQKALINIDSLINSQTLPTPIASLCPAFCSCCPVSGKLFKSCRNVVDGASEVIEVGGSLAGPTKVNNIYISRSRGRSININWLQVDPVWFFLRQQKVHKENLEGCRIGWSAKELF